tara:strand:+ start:845 stop:1249 length:405 start_codon:yes stop_codon:yes gene_type:complete
VTTKEKNMKITRKQLKRIIKEEYSKLKRKGLIKESGYYGYGGHEGGSMAGHPGMGSEMPPPGPRKFTGWMEFIDMVEHQDYDSASAWLQERCPVGVVLEREDENMFMGMAEDGAPPSELQSEWSAFCSGEGVYR